MHKMRLNMFKFGTNSLVFTTKISTNEWLNFDIGVYVEFRR